MFIGETMGELRLTVQGFVRRDCISDGVMTQRSSPSENRNYVAWKQCVLQAAAGSAWPHGGGSARISHSYVQAI